MPRRPGAPTYGKRYVGNRNHMEVHDLDRETTACQINEIIRSGHVVTFNPDTAEEARRQRYDRCAHCLGSSTR